MLCPHHLLNNTLDIIESYLEDYQIDRAKQPTLTPFGANVGVEAGEAGLR